MLSLARFLAPQKNPRRLRRGWCRSSQRDAPPLPEGVRIRHEPLDFGDGSTSELRGGTYTQAGLGRDYPEHPGASSRSEMAAGQAVDHLPRPLYERKKAARWADGSGRGQSQNLGGGFPGRVLVEPGGIAHLEQLLRGGQAPSPHSTVGGQRRPRAESHLLLRTLYLPEIGDTWLRFVDGRPISSITTQNSLSGAWRSSKRSARRSWCSSGTTRAGMSPERSGAGSEDITEKSRRAEAG